jgi:hypothetical protein
MMSAAAKNRRRRALLGAVMVEYAFLLTAVGIPTAVGTVAGGQAMFKNYKEARGKILNPAP